MLMIVGLIVLVLVGLWTVASIGAFFLALIPWAIVGLITGWAAARLTGTRLTPGWTILTGVAGSWLGPAAFAGLLHIPVGTRLLSPLHLVASVLGAAILITFARVIARPSLMGSSRPRLSSR